MTRLIAIFAVALVAVTLAVTLALTFLPARTAGSDGPFATCRAGNVAGQASIGGPFELVSAQGETVTDRDVLTEPSLLYFGYTYCPDVCPLDVARNASAVDILQERGQSVTPVFISIDPRRDTPDVVGDFVANMHPKMIGLTGSAEQVDAASKAYKTYYKAHDDEGDDYLVDHSAFSYLVDPEHGFLDFFRRDLPAEDLADRIGCFLDRI